MTFIGSCPIHAGRMSAFWPAFCDALRREHPILTEAALRKAKEFNSQRYYYQGIGRYAPSAAYARGLADLQVLANLIPADGYVHGSKPTSIDAGHLRIHRQYLFLRDRYSTQAVRCVASQSRSALHYNSRHHRFGSSKRTMRKSHTRPIGSIY